MTAPANHQFQKFALPAPSSGDCAKAARPHPSLCPCRAATLNHSQRQTSRHDAAGAAAWACRVEALAVGRTGRLRGGLGCDPFTCRDANGPGDTSNDRLANLRNVSAAENCRNRARAATNRTGATGVYMSRGKRFSVQINVDGKRSYLGTYPTFEAALRVRKEAEAIYGFHPNHDRSRASGDGQ